MQTLGHQRNGCRLPQHLLRLTIQASHPRRGSKGNSGNSTVVGDPHPQARRPAFMPSQRLDGISPESHCIARQSEAVGAQTVGVDNLLLVRPA